MLPNIWMYWEGIPLPHYINLCFETITKHCLQDFQIHHLDEQTIKQYIPEEDFLYSHRWHSIPQKTDYIRLYLLYHYGGIWMDADIICFRSLLPYWERTNEYDYIGFGCYFNDCGITMDGTDQPANWVMISRSKGDLITMAFLEAKRILFQTPYLLKQSYHCLGKDLLRNCISRLRQQRPFWSYFHVKSECVERTSSGMKLTNQILVSHNYTILTHDKDCYKKRIFLPLYNTAPGFPKWFLRWQREDLLRNNLFICQYFRYSLFGV